MYNVIVFFEGKPGKSPIEHVYNNVPEGVTSEQVAARARAEYPNETVVELKRYRADRSDISEASSVTDAPPASQAVATRGDATQSARDTERLRLLESEPPSATRDREIELLKQGRGAYPNLTGLGQVGVVPAAPVAPTAPVAGPITPQNGNSNFDLEGAGPGGQVYGEFDTMGDAVPAEGGPINRESLYSVGGGVVGALVGALAGPLAVPASTLMSTAGSALGTYFGAYEDEIRKGATPANARAAAERAAGIDIAWSAAGGLMFKIGGKAVKLTADSGIGKWVKNKLGFTGAAPAADAVVPQAVKAGPSVFSTTDATMAQEAADKAAANLQRSAKAAGQPGATPGQFNEAPSWAEKQVRAGDPGYFQGVRESAEQRLEADARRFREGVAGASMDPLAAAGRAGKGLQAAAEATEQKIKERHRATFDALSDANGPLGAQAGQLVSTASIKAMAANELATAGITAERKAVLQDILETMPDKMTLAQANAHISNWMSEARGMARPGQAKSPLQGFFEKAAGQLRNGLEAGLDTAAKRGDIDPALRAQIKAAKDDYRQMHEVVFSPTMEKVARANPEDVIKVISGEGATTEIQEIKRLVALANQQGDNVMAKSARDAVRGLRAEYLAMKLPNANAWRNLHKMSDRDKAQLELFFPVGPQRQTIERFSQAAQILERNPSTGGANTGIFTGQAIGAGASVGALVGSLFGPVGTGAGAAVGAVAGFMSADKARKIIARSLTDPKLVDKMPAVSAYALALAKGGAPVAVPQAVTEWYDIVKEDLQ